MAQWTTTYNALLDDLETYTEDDTAEFQSQVEACINRAEERILRDLDVSLFNAVTSTSTAAGVDTIDRPNPRAVIKSIYVTQSSSHLIRRTLDYVQAHGGDGVPVYFHENAEHIIMTPTPDAVYTLKISEDQRITPLSPSNQTNWLTENAADLLLWGSLVESEAFLIAPERVQEFEQKYASALGPIRAMLRDSMQSNYEPISPTPQPQQTR